MKRKSITKTNYYPCKINKYLCYAPCSVNDYIWNTAAHFSAININFKSIFLFKENYNTRLDSMSFGA